MNSSYHTECRAIPLKQKTAFDVSRSKQYSRSHFKNDPSSNVLLHWGSSSSTTNNHINAHFRIPKNNK